MADLAMPAGAAKRRWTSGWLARSAGTLLVLSALGLLAQLEIVSNASLRVDVAVVVVFLASLYYLVVDWRLGLAVLGAAIVLYLIAVVLPLWLVAAFLGAGGAGLLAAWIVGGRG